MLDKAIFYVLVLFAFVSTFSMAGQTIFASLSLLLALIKIAMDRKLPNTEGVRTTGIAVYFGTMAILLFFSTDMKESVIAFLNYMYRCSIFFVVYLFIKTRKEIETLIATLIISITITDLYAVFQWITGVERTAAFFSHAMILAGCLVLLIPLLLIQTIGASTVKQRGLWLFSFFLSCAALIANKTRGAWIAVTAIPFIMFFISHHKRHISYGIIAMIILGSVSYMYIPTFQGRVGSIFDLEQQSNSERLLLWQSSAEMFKDYPLTGVGLGEFGDKYQAGYVSPQAREPKLSHAHNNFLHVLVETGILGFSAFCYMFFTFIRQHYRFLNGDHIWINRLAAAAILFTCTLLIQGITEYNFGNSVVVRLFWFLTGITYAAYRIVNKHARNKSDIC